MCTKQNGETAVNPAPLTEQATEHFTKEEKEHLKFFFDWQTKEFLASFGQKPEEVENLDYYPIIKLRSITKLLGHLHRPWDQYIPFLYQAFAQHIASIEDTHLRRQALEQSSEIMAVIFYIFQNRANIDRLGNFYAGQIRILKEWIKENNKSNTPTEQG